MPLNIQGDIPAFCQAVNCETSTKALIASRAYGGWIALCESHAILQLSFENGVTN